MEGEAALNAHAYDAKAKEIYDELVGLDDIEDELQDFEVVLNEVGEFIMESMCPYALKVSAKATLQLFRGDRDNNKDQHGLTVEDILPRIWRRVKSMDDKTGLEYFVEQLSDVKEKGPCNNGRINRLLQVYRCLLEEKDE